MNPYKSFVTRNCTLCILTLLFLSPLLESKVQSQNLPAYLKMAGEENQMLQAKFSAYESAMQRIAQVNALPDPKLSFAYFINPVETRVGPQQARLSLSQQFPWFGTLKARGLIATSQAESLYADALDYRNWLFYQVKSTYYDLYVLNREREIVKENLDLLNSYENMVRVKYENGKGSMADILRIQMRREALQTEYKVLQDKIRPLQSRFNELLHRQAGDTVIISDSLSLTAISGANFHFEDLSGNPQLEALEKKKEGARHQQTLALKSGLPQLSVGLDYVMVGPRNDIELPNNGKDALMPMVGVSLPIFRKKYRAAEKEAALNYQRFDLVKNAKEESLRTFFEEYQFRLEKGFKNTELYRELYQKANHALRILTSEYSTGRGEFVELLRMEEEMLKYKLAFEKSLAEVLKYQAALEYIIGK